MNKIIVDQIIESIALKTPSKDACKKIGVSESFFRVVLQKENLKWIRAPYRIYELNHNYFDVIDNSNKAYWLGFLYADGHVSDTGALHLQLQGRDIKVLEDLKKSLGYNGPIKLRQVKGKDYYGLRIWSVGICSALNKLGINRNKTKEPNIPDIDEKFYKDFLRGLIDGDGCIYTKRKEKSKMISCVNILVHEKCVPKVIRMIECIVPNFTCSIGNHHRTSYLKILAITGNRQTFKILKTIYFGAEIYLIRKYEKYKEIEQYYQDNPILLKKTERFLSQSHRSRENLILFPEISSS